MKSKPWGLGDVFPVVFHNGTVEPATNAAKAFFSGESSGAGDDDTIFLGYTSSGDSITKEKNKTVNNKKFAYDRDYKNKFIML